jgi:hypothetical protein
MLPGRAGASFPDQPERESFRRGPYENGWLPSVAWAVVAVPPQTTRLPATCGMTSFDPFRTFGSTYDVETPATPASQLRG